MAIPSLPSAPLHVVTPLVSAPAVAQRLGLGHVFMKMESAQPSGSFKVFGTILQPSLQHLLTIYLDRVQIRGIGHHVTQSLKRNPHLRTVVTSSGGNAGMAAVVAAKSLNLDVLVFIPTSTPKFMADRLASEGGKVIVAGDVWDEAHAAAILWVADHEDQAMLVHPFEGQELWDGHSTLVTEVAEQLPDGMVPDAVICVVGGGGLLSGIVQGLERHYDRARRPIVLAVETEGAASLAAAFRANRPVQIKEITSIAKTLGARQVSAQPLLLRERYGPEKIRSVLVSDELAVRGLVSFADEFRVVVEPSCGAGLSLCYAGSSSLSTAAPELGPDSVVVVVVCGGGVVTIEAIEGWQRQFGITQ
ncbi:hypothetical protein HKX48_005895 [Thoreauomyces humboldtii]|nr:hypothetical protein HKX48_005895 [Thoreauomyces humboldtii]